jgi:hypothetical protein
MKLRDIGFGKIFLRLGLSFGPALGALIVIHTCGDHVWSSSIISLFNRIDGNASPIGSAVVLLVLAAFFSTTISLWFYFLDVWREVTRHVGQEGRLSLRLAFYALFASVILLAWFWLLVTLMLCGVVHIDGRAVMTDFLVLARWGAALVFFSFLMGDALLYLAQAARRRTFRPVNCSDLSVAFHENDMSLSCFSVFVIDMPAVVIAGLTLYLIHELRTNSSFHKYRELAFPTHVVLKDLSGDAFELALYGLEAGILAAALITSQLVFAVLMARWHVQAARIRHRQEELTSASQ